MPIDYVAARSLLDCRFRAVSAAVIAGAGPLPIARLGRDIERVFASSTQAYREVLVGCLLARWDNRDIDITSPYVNQGDKAFSGRALDERVVNPFLKANQIPSSGGPYLSAFRRSVRFDESTQTGLRDQDGYDALLRIIRHVATTESKEDALEVLDHVLLGFYMLREAAQIPLARPQRMSLQQMSKLMERLLAASSGGRFPMYLVEATLTAIKLQFALNWKVTAQGINVSDASGGMGGDIEVTKDGKLVFAAEVTERLIDADRVTATFGSKIAPNAIEDYLFFTSERVDEAAQAQARSYFSLGHEVNFLDIADWIRNILAGIGSGGRTHFLAALLDRLASDDTPTAIRTVWNQQIADISRAE